MAYNNALKRICVVPVSTSSHLIANLLNQFLLKHCYCFILARFYMKILHFQSMVFKWSRSVLKSGMFFKSVDARFKTVYSMSLHECDVEIVKAKIAWLQTHHPQTGQGIP